ncbi:MAG: hypothetical protein ACE14M_11090 [Terriglobales bacterium]
MAQWIAFDSETASAVRQKTQGEVCVAEGDALSAALGSDVPVIAVLPAAAAGASLLLSVRHNRTTDESAGGVVEAAAAEAGEQDRRARISYVPTGFLGLSDAPVYEEEEPRPKKSWWRRLTE